jgi:glyoxylase-like metal-dependent hydrolase (beta-lactamase superfamily II)
MKRMFFCFILFLVFSQLNIPADEEFKIISQVDGPGSTNCYLICCTSTKDAGIIDAAGPLDSLTWYISKNGLNIKYIFLTHAHWDHVQGLFELKKKFPAAEVCLSYEEYTAMQGYYSFAKETDPVRFEKVMQDSALAGMMNFDLTLIKPNIFVGDNEEYLLGDIKIKTLFTPGHSYGSMCFYCDNILFSGDVLMYRAVGNTDFYKASRNDQIESVRKLYSLFPDSTIVYPGHGQFTDIGSEKIHNKYITVNDGDWDAR